jgi:UDP-glucose 4-epimerase
MRSDSASKRILVTGGFGFIGSHLVERLLADGTSHVHVVDSLVTSPIDVGAYVARLHTPPRLTWDVCTLEEYCARPAREAWDEIYHLASVVGPVGVLAHAGKIAGMVVNDTYRIIDLAVASGARVVDVSTSEVYGGGRDGYCSERDFKVIQPKVTVRLEYAVGKLAAEIALVNTTKVAPLHACVIRPFNVAGPRQSGKGGFVLPRFIAQVLGGASLTVYNDGSMVRAFTHVSDIVSGIVLAMGRGRTGEAYNLGNPANKTSIFDLARRVISVVGGPSKIEFVDPKQLFGPLFEEANDKFPDSDKATTELGWVAEHDIDRVIIDTARYMRSGRRD